MKVFDDDVLADILCSGNSEEKDVIFLLSDVCCFGPVSCELQNFTWDSAVVNYFYKFSQLKCQIVSVD